MCHGAPTIWSDLITLWFTAYSHHERNAKFHLEAAEKEDIFPSKFTDSPEIYLLDKNVKNLCSSLKSSFFREGK